MNSVKYLGLDVHGASISAAVRNAKGELTLECTFRTERQALLDFIGGLRGTLQVAFEEGTQSAWLYEQLRGRVAKVVASDPRKNALLKSGNKNDRIDGRKLSELLYAGLLTAVYHGEHGLETLKELARSYLVLTEDTTRVLQRLKAIYRGQAIGTRGKKLYGTRHRLQWLVQLVNAGRRWRAERLYEQLDELQGLRQQARRQLILESQKHAATALLRSVPFLGPIRAALLLAWVQTPHRFRTKRQFWAYCGLGLETRSSADYQVVNGQLERRQRPVFIRGLNWNHNHALKNLFKGAAVTASARPGPWQEFYQVRLDKGIQPELARLTLARKIAAIALTLWKKGAKFDVQHLKLQAA